MSRLQLPPNLSALAAPQQMPLNIAQPINDVQWLGLIAAILYQSGVGVKASVDKAMDIGVEVFTRAQEFGAKLKAAQSN